MDCQTGSWDFLSQIHKNTHRYLTILCCASVLLTTQVYTTRKIFEGQTEFIPCVLIPQNQYWANKYIALRLISRPFRQEEFFLLYFFPVKIPRACSYDSSVCLFCHIRNPLVYVSASNSLHRMTPQFHMFFPHKSTKSLIVSLITSTCRSIIIAPSILLLTYSFNLNGFGGLKLCFDKVL